MNRPPVLFLDEPTTGLDITSRNELWEMIRELVSDGTTVLLTTQYLEEADILAERIAVVDGGRVIANDTPARAEGAARQHRLRDGHAGQVPTERAVALLTPDRGPAASSARASTCASRPNRAPSALIEILRTLDAAGLEPQSLTVREPSLDDVFLALTGRHAEAADGEAVRPRAEMPHERDRAGRRRPPTPTRDRRIPFSVVRDTHGDREAQPAGLPARAAAAGLLHDPAGDLRADVPLRLRRRDRHRARACRTSTS